MRLHRWLRCGLAAGACAMALFSAARGSAQVLINEVVKEERTTGAGAISPDVREFLELYNAGATPVDIGNWSIVTTNLANGTPINDVLPSGATIPAGGYYVIAVAGRTVANADHYITIGATEELYPDLTGSVIELKDASSRLVDAVGYDIFRGTNTVTPTPEQEAQIGGGYWGQYPVVQFDWPPIAGTLSRRSRQQRHRSRFRHLARHARRFEQPAAQSAPHGSQRRRGWRPAASSTTTTSRSLPPEPSTPRSPAASTRRRFPRRRKEARPLSPGTSRAAATPPTRKSWSTALISTPTSMRIPSVWPLRRTTKSGTRPATASARSTASTEILIRPARLD